MKIPSIIWKTELVCNFLTLSDKNGLVEPKDPFLTNLVSLILSFWKGYKATPLSLSSFAPIEKAKSSPGLIIYSIS